MSDEVHAYQNHTETPIERQRRQAAEWEAECHYEGEDSDPPPADKNTPGKKDKSSEPLPF